MKRLIAASLLLGFASTAFAQKHVTSPQEQFGFQPGADRKLADWNELVAYYQKLSKESPAIRYEELGKTTEGRPFVALTISAPENLAHLDHFLDIQRRLADPRITSPEQAKQLIAEGKTILAVTANIHSTEIASAQSAALFAYQLATDQSPRIQNILKNVIIVLVPSQNPDGEQLVVDWYKKYLGTPYEGTQPVVIWHHYTGHDDNRDWATFTQVETQLTTEKVLNHWHPEILYDIHQMGANGPRIYLPPWVDPVDPNVDPLLVSSMNALGSNTALEIAETGKQGVLINGVYDFWSPLRDYISLHNGLRILTESASVNLASPIEIPFSRLDRGIGYDAKVAKWNFPDPWKGGTWRLGDIVAYQQDAFFSLANSAAVYRERYLSDFYKIGQRAVTRERGGAYAWVIPAEQRDPGVTARLVNTLRTADVEVGRATAAFDAGGRHFAAGSYVVPMGQPFAAFAKSVLEVQHYPNIAQYPGGPLQRPYDVTASTLPLLFGVDAVEVAEPFQVATSPVTRAVPVAPAASTAAAAGWTVADTTNASLYAVFSLLAQGVKVYRLTGGDTPGTIYIPAQPGVETKLRKATADFALAVTPANAAPGGLQEQHLPRVGLYQSWVASMDEGWTRFIFDQNHIPYTRLVDADIRKGGLHDHFDAIVLPDNSARAITSGARGGGEGEALEPTPRGANGRATDGHATPPDHTIQANADATGTIPAQRVTRTAADGGTPNPPTPPEYTGGLGPQGIQALDEFVHAGGTVIAFNQASGVFLRDGGPVENALAHIDRSKFFIPGSILQVSVNPHNPLAYGFGPTVPIFYENGPVFHTHAGAQSALDFTSDAPLLSGWIQGGQFLKGTSVLAQQDLGQGHLILFGFRPQYRAISEVTYRFLFNALLLSSAKPGTPGASAAMAQADGIGGRTR